MFCLSTAVLLLSTDGCGMFHVFLSSSYFIFGFWSCFWSTCSWSVVETLKDYATKALISSVDHLGSVAFKVNSFLDDKLNEFSDTKVRFSNIEQVLNIVWEAYNNTISFVDNTWAYIFCLRKHVFKSGLVALLPLI